MVHDRYNYQEQNKMKFAIEISFGEHLVLDVSEAGPMLAALKTAFIANEKNEAGKTVYTPSSSRDNDSPGTLHVSLLPDEAFAEPDDAKKALVKENEIATNRWLECYSRYSEAKNKILELENKIKSIQNGVC